MFAYILLLIVTSLNIIALSFELVTSKLQRAFYKQLIIHF